MQDKEAILQAALDYIEGWYHGDAARMDRALYPKLAKRRVTPTGELWHVDKEWMVKATGDGRGRIENPEKGRKQVTIFDTTDTMSCVKIVSEKFIDYLHLTKDGEKWFIVNVLWDYVDP
ncbi:MAG: nuclear transport factor 2 family protein [Chloroflexi bacterium]|nr:nuclear transport factor 2 family protein [Chloroflexota bacterium]